MKYKTQNMPDGAGCHVAAVGNTFFEFQQHVDKALTERVCQFRFAHLVPDKDRDPQLAAKLGEERGIHHILFVHRYLANLRDPNRRNKFWNCVATDTTREQRELNKNGQDLTMMFLNNQSSYYIVNRNPDAKPLFLDELKEAIENFYSERKIEIKKLPKNWRDSILRDPLIKIVNSDYCRLCKMANASAESCAGHFHPSNLSKRDIVYGLELVHYPLGIQDKDLQEFVAQQKADPVPVPVVAEEDVDMKDDPQDADLHSYPVGDPAHSKPFEALKSFSELSKDLQVELSQIAKLGHDASQPGKDARTQRRKKAKGLLPHLQTKELDNLLRAAKKATKVATQSYPPVRIGDSYRPCP